MMARAVKCPRTIPNSCEPVSGNQPKFLFLMVGGTGLEPVTSAV